MMLLVKTCIAQAFANLKYFGTASVRSALRLVVAFAFLAGPLATLPAQADYNLLANGDFDTPVVPNLNGNNLSGNSWGSWTSGNQLNPIRVNGTTYVSGPDNAYSGTQYLDIGGPSTVYQYFTLPSTQRITFGAAFSNRESAFGGYIAPTDQIFIYNSSNALVASSNAVTFTSAMGDEVWQSVSGTATLPAGTYRYVISLSDYSHVDAAYARATTVKLQKITDYGVAGAFTFTQSNLVSTPGPITTTIVGTATPITPAAISVTALGTDVNINEANNVPFVLTSFSCSDANRAFTGNPVSFGNVTGYNFTIPSFTIIPGADITCVSRSSKMPSITVTKISNGGVGNFSFLGTNGWGFQTITTTTSGIGAAGAETFIDVTNVATTISESIPSDYVSTAINCTGLNVAGTATYNVAGGVVVLSSENFGFGVKVACTFTNTKKPTVTITKISNNGVGPFSFSGTNGVGSQTITTSTSGVGLTSLSQTLTTASTATSITETVPPTYKLASITCTGLGSGGTATPNLSTATVALNAAATPLLANINCTFTNDKLIPSLTVVKSASTAGPVSVGTVITYTYILRNTGNTTISSVNVGENFTGNGTVPTPRNEVLSLDVAPLGDSTDVTANNGVWSLLSPGDQLTFTAPYTVTQADIDLLQ